MPFSGPYSHALLLPRRLRDAHTERECGLDTHFIHSAENVCLLSCMCIIVWIYCTIFPWICGHISPNQANRLPFTLSITQD